MKYTKLSHKAIALFLTFIFLPSLFPVNYVFASNNSPTAPEASSFEPVDAADMVSLATGDLNYVLPLLNVPSPEGGYPISLAYHSGITMDQEASWVGLGWSLNPGAINRSVNGYPDDWKSGSFKEYFYDKGESETIYFGSLGYTSLTTGASVGLNVSWGDNRSFGGSVSAGVGFSQLAGFDAEVGSNGFSLGGSIGLGKNSPIGIAGSIGTNGVGIGINYDPLDPSSKSRISAGVNSSWSGDVAANVSYAHGEGVKKNSLGLNFSSQGLGVGGRIGIAGFRHNLSFETAISQSDYTTINEGFFIPLYFPVGEGLLTFTFGRQKVGYELDKTENNIVNGPLYLNDFPTSIGYWKCSYATEFSGAFRRNRWESHKVSDGSHQHENFNTLEFEVEFVETANSLTDIYEVDVNDNSTKFKLDNNNAVFPNYDSYRVAAQGLSGSIRPTLFKSGALFGLSKEIEDSNGNYNLEYELPEEGNLSQISAFNSKAYFHFENENTSSLLVNPIKFNDSFQAANIFGYTDTSSSVSNSERKHGSRFVEYYTNDELSGLSPFNSGLLKANESIDYSNNDAFESDGIGAFKITMADGKTYHYSLPVYNHELIFRQYGFNDVNPGKNDAYFEKRQLKKYATHWLLTAITGPDFIDLNGNNIADNDDLGYWVCMDYGKWTDGYIWYAPHGEEFRVDEENPEVKNYTWGRKDVYYLDQIKTRTHNALFVKEHRNDSYGKSLVHEDRLDKSTSNSLSFSNQSLLRLKEIILLKNEDTQDINKTNLTAIPSMPSAHYVNSIQWNDSISDGGGIKQVNYSLQNNVLDSKDHSNWTSLYERAVKIVDFTGYSYDLATGAPYTQNGVGGRLTLNHVTLKGKGGEQLMPSYNFRYKNGSYSLSHKDAWGYNKFNPQLWNLEEIQMPTGGKIKMEYEPDTFTSAIDYDLSWSATIPDNNNFIYVNENANFTDIGIKVNDMLNVSHKKFVSCNPTTNPNNPDNPTGYSEIIFDTYFGLARVVNVSSNQLILQLDGLPEPTTYTTSASCEFFGFADYTTVNYSEDYFSSGLRTKSITVTDGVDSFKTEYNYNKPGTNETSGIVSYIPFIPNSEEVPYGHELPTSIPMYGNVRTTSYGSNNESLGYTDYQFQVLSPKQFDKVKFGEILEFNSIQEKFTNELDVDVDIREIEIVDHMSSLGQILSTATYNANGHLLNKTINNYANGEDFKQGIAQESYQTYKKVNYNNANTRDKWVINSSTRTNYPSVLKSTTVINGGFQSTTYFEKYDSKSGQLLETITEQSDGIKFKTETVPAYHKYPQLGSKIDDISNKHMLTQTAMNKSYIKESEDWIETNATINTWKPSNYSFLINGVTTDKDVWRRSKNYVWDGPTSQDGLFEGFISNTDDGFDWSNSASSQPANWKFISEITKYDNYSMPIESLDINNNAATTKMGDNHTKIITSANGFYNEIHYSGAEYLNGSSFDGGIDGVGQSSEKAHTGTYSIKVSNQEGFKTTISGHHTATKYKISVWASKENHSNAQIYDGINLTSFNGEKIISGDWVLLNHYVDLSSSDHTIYVNSTSGNIYYDDFRIHPVTSTMTSYVYDQWDELVAILDANNLATKYEYDTSSRLLNTSIEVEDSDNFKGGFKKVTSNQYRYNQQENVSNINPLFSVVTYGSSSENHQVFEARVSGGSGNYTFRWFKGIDDSSTQFETSWSGADSTFRWDNMSGCETHYVKLVVTDNDHPSLRESIRVIKNNNECGDFQEVDE